MKPKNEIFARHLLSMRKQQENESIAEYLQELRQLSQDCKLRQLQLSNIEISVSRIPSSGSLSQLQLGRGCWRIMSLT